MAGSLNDELFSWERTQGGNVHFPYAVRPRMSATTVLSYRRKVALDMWCREQFGEDAVNVTGTTFAFAREADQTMFVIMWSGVPVKPATNEQIDASTRKTSGPNHSLVDPTLKP